MNKQELTVLAAHIAEALEVGKAAAEKVADTGSCNMDRCILQKLGPLDPNLPSRIV